MNNPNTKKPLRSARQSFTVLKNAFKQIGGYGLFAGYGVFLIACCALLCLLEPETFPTFGNAVWYAFQAITTIGFGDIVAHTTACRAITILIGLSSLPITKFPDIAPPTIRVSTTYNGANAQAVLNSVIAPLEE